MSGGVASSCEEEMAADTEVAGQPGTSSAFLAGPADAVSRTPFDIGGQEVEGICEESFNLVGCHINENVLGGIENSELRDKQ